MFRLSNDDRRELTARARRAIVGAVIEKYLPEFSKPSDALLVSAGVFVTLRCGGKLRGCVGQLESPDPLADTVVRVAIDAAQHDCRFAPVTPDEVAKLEIDISVLSPLERISPETITVGRHGLMVVRSERRGLLLPQVAAERNWSSERFLEETCVKAGLPRNDWKNPATQIFGFTAEIFTDSGVDAVDSVESSASTP